MPLLVGPVVRPGTWESLAQPRITGEEVVLRPWEPGDAVFLEHAYADPAIQRWHARSLTIDEAEQWIQARADCWTNESAADWAVTAGGRVTGRVGFRTVALGEGRAEMAYWTAPQFRGHRLSSRALHALTEWATTTGGLRRLDLEHAVANQASCKVALRCGYRAEGIAIKSVLHADGWHDMHRHGYAVTN